MVANRPKMFFVRISLQLLVIGLVTGISWSSDFTYTSAAADSNEQATMEASILQRMINEAEQGSSIVLPEGSYSGYILIDKKLTIRADKTVLSSIAADSAVVIKGDGVVIQGLAIKQEHADEETAAVLVQADNVVLMDLNIKTQGFGIMLRDANEATILNNEIAWKKIKNANSSISGHKGNGIDLYNSYSNRIEQNRIYNMKDGIYLEKGSQLSIKENRIYSSRYGIHCMYIDESQIVGNIGEYNFTGAMIMGVKDTRISNNSFLKQSWNVYSQGILLYDVQTSTVERNQVDGNRVGIYMERSSNNELKENSVNRNFIGIQMLNAENNKLHYNDFVANVIEAEAVNSKDNDIFHNYWDSAQGLDLNDDGISEIAYSINPFYQQLISDKPAFQLFFQSPGMAFLSSMYEGNRDQWTTDSSPFMHLNVAGDHTSTLSDMEGEHVLSEKTFMLIIACMLLATASLIIIYTGGSKS